MTEDRLAEHLIMLVIELRLHSLLNLLPYILRSR
jgi:hypothetical protein